MPALSSVSLVQKQIAVSTEPHRHEYLTRIANLLTGSFTPQRVPDDIYT
jgi:hypothetical protein